MKQLYIEQKIKIFEKQEKLFEKMFKEHNMTNSKKAMEIAKRVHKGVRKDKTPEITHMFNVAERMLKMVIGRFDIKRVDELVASAFLHDTIEDCKDKYSESDLKKDFNKSVNDNVLQMSKKDGFEKNDEDRKEYYDNMMLDASLLKSEDRIENLSTMTEVFSLNKKFDYLEESINYIIPMLEKHSEIALNKKDYIEFYIIKESINKLMLQTEYLKYYLNVEKN